ncbi:hypothetical protein F4821DRAFT_92828 [Hypoxylon rubiginosum]|uniref:Uncharacterized protein n=1 Tax=Hypoxylon rubiginosum TaxID=110542 RepID=A0ACC0D6C5_9PEZI|nr:hypothetical protein F4821DRAFT_92828 [Hypoxylon rubiginosum]
MAELTHLTERYVDKYELDSLLQRLFGDSNYNVKSQGDTIEVSAPRKLTKAEIDSVTTTG